VNDTAEGRIAGFDSADEFGRIEIRVLLARSDSMNSVGIFQRSVHGRGFSTVLERRVETISGERTGQPRRVGGQRCRCGPLDRFRTDSFRHQFPLPSISSDNRRRVKRRAASPCSATIRTSARRRSLGAVSAGSGVGFFGAGIFAGSGDEGRLVTSLSHFGGHRGWGFRMGSARAVRSIRRRQ